MPSAPAASRLVSARRTTSPSGSRSGGLGIGSADGLGSPQGESVALSYPELWVALERGSRARWLRDHVNELRARYDVEAAR